MLAYSVLYALRDAARSSLARPLVTLGAALLVALAVAASATATAAGLVIEDWSLQLAHMVTVRAFLADDAVPSQAAARARQIAGVVDVTIDDKDQELKHLGQILPDHGAALAAFPSNPLPNALVIRVQRPEEVPRVAAALRSQPGVTDVIDAQTYLAQLLTATRTLQGLATGAMLAFALAAAVACASAVSLGMVHRHLEIRLRYLYGTSPVLVGLHFALEGALLAGLGSLGGAYAFLAISHRVLLALGQIPFLGVPPLPTGSLALTTGLAGVAIGAVAGLWAVPGQVLREAGDTA